jgi:hypothetical protein
LYAAGFRLIFITLCSVAQPFGFQQVTPSEQLSVTG